MDKEQKSEIIDFINKKYQEEVPRPFKFIIRKKANKIQKLRIEDFPKSYLDCTMKDFILILKEALEKDKLKL
ncbi:MAG: hypothetical protein GWN01_17490 [Nitrosopumilaceae archaeon]|nr:hypothetical protein [Nitrosopumilaceae archaeon]NIU02618.1 hypothetical protein [Nitrosopumilaceae archaeon]NIU89081.1 hypothetical protein [Nitrosopumilaceae archaeon]NIV67184.1 hypothetical protein [Nitrosopumilaceae archaeon]NIX63219.1 hypothetical protein [Nitrosopumilaceae archaeon]